MPLEPSADDREKLAEITAAWEEYDRTRDGSAIADHLGKEMMLLPPGGSPVEGKAAVLEILDRPTEDGNSDSTQWIENVFVSGNLAVVHVCKGSIPADADEPIDGGTTGLDVYRRGENGEWVQLLSMWNDEI